MSNSRADRPYQKVLYGKQQMHEITGRLHRVEQEDDLVAELMVLLNDSTRLVILLSVPQGTLVCVWETSRLRRLLILFSL